MKALSASEIRQAFIDFFVAREHLLQPGHSLVPDNDKSLLLINSGMAPLKAYFTGQKKPPAVRMVTCQKCIRTIDIDDVGHDARHGSFFEMLGNFSFGDYFKEDAIVWAWEFLTDVCGLPAERLHVSVYEEDAQAHDIWLRRTSVDPAKVVRLGKDENFWEHGAGPCGPCSEIHFDRGSEHGCRKPDCAVGCDCDRFMEVWNLVFTQFESGPDGYVPLKQTNIDTGMGLERIAMVLQGATSIFEIDHTRRLRDAALQSAKHTPPDATVLANIITDHVRSVVFLAGDGVGPSNEGRGYIARRLLRRAVRHIKTLQCIDAADIAQRVIDEYCGAYPNLTQQSAHILTTIQTEAARFNATLEGGMNQLETYIAALRKQKKTRLDGADAFKLYDTFGFPPELTREILGEAGMDLDSAGFDEHMQAQKDRARAARSTSNFMGADGSAPDLLTDATSEFCGYTAHSCEAKITRIIVGDELADALTDATDAAIVLDCTPFYAASGGQAGDCGVFWAAGTPCFDVHTTIHAPGGAIVHLGRSRAVQLRTGDVVTATVDAAVRTQTAAHHSSAHLLQYALRKHIGTHVVQAGSDVNHLRMRFDFAHQSALTPQERADVEQTVNEMIAADIEVRTQLTTIKEAGKQGALMLFDEKYADRVRQVSIGADCVELCGGTHVPRTSALGAFKILSEQGVSAGVRRIEAVAGAVAVRMGREAMDSLGRIAALLSVPADGVPKKVQEMLDSIKTLKKAADRADAADLRSRLEAKAAQILQGAAKAGSFAVAVASVGDLDVEGLRGLGDLLKEKMQSGCVFLCAKKSDSAQFLAIATKDAVAKGIHAGNIVREAAKLCGGGGGGRPDFAQAGAKDTARVDDAMAAARGVVMGVLGGS